MTAKKGEFAAFVMNQLKVYQDECAKKLFAVPTFIDFSKKYALVDLPRFGD